MHRGMTHDLARITAHLQLANFEESQLYVYQPKVVLKVFHCMELYPVPRVFIAKILPIEVVLCAGDRVKEEKEDKGTKQPNMAQLSYQKLRIRQKNKPKSLFLLSE
ncbi:hypothetical protein TorRG33x02_267780 [Trema orientale]|uniref:Uncharacterized protein n=1 Tax=Trema orientale TaxID=63057 RepID=A0A2P5CZF1_TREOI|nr:hypothetical protein TorRG33x02_267780 [Trema orientale]